MKTTKKKRKFPLYTYHGCPLTKNKTPWCYKTCVPDSEGRGLCGRQAAHSLKDRVQESVLKQKSKREIHPVSIFDFQQWMYNPKNFELTWVRNKPELARDFKDIISQQKNMVPGPMKYLDIGMDTRDMVINSFRVNKGDEDELFVGTHDLYDGKLEGEVNLLDVLEEKLREREKELDRLYNERKLQEEKELKERLNKISAKEGDND